ncbi:MAG: phosphatidylserine decarboxylase [Chlorobiaceae bacterium]|jgi:phosphatidylserine decarboxylase|nr:phosphatidylserine decarboxylase [Chlorobiaceae bacterium]NTW63990.1 phosphatidylserine decarboxylase [Chlorobiaceae bacterium]
MPTPYGYTTLLKTTLICCLLTAITFVFFPEFLTFTAITASTVILFTLYFLRDPERQTPSDQQVIVAPADGKIVLIKPLDHSFTGKGSVLVSIFMSPFNVHVNRIPLDGTVVHLRYIPGKFLMAFDNRSMESNEKMEIGIDNGSFRVFFSQVSGFLARRIVCPLRLNERVISGKRFGMIKFGSRIDMILPSSVKIMVQPGQKTTAGETVIALYQ